MLRVHVPDKHLSLQVSLIHLADERFVAVVRILGLGLHVALCRVYWLGYLLHRLLLRLFLAKLLLRLVWPIAAVILLDDLLLLVAGPLTRPCPLALAQRHALLARSEAPLASFARLRGPLD